MLLRILFTVVVFLSSAGRASAQAPPPEAQIAAAVQALPSVFRDGAGVLGYGDGAGLIELRPSSNGIICLADDPADNRFHVACYHDSLEPFMAHGRRLRAEGHDRAEVERLRREAIEAGEVAMPPQAAMVYSLTGEADAWDPATGEIGDVRALQVVYTPYATIESTGLPPSAPPGQPWLMDPGEPWAHIMISTPRPE